MLIYMHGSGDEARNVRVSMTSLKNICTLHEIFVLAQTVRMLLQILLIVATRHSQAL